MSRRKIGWAFVQGVAVVFMLRCIGVEGWRLIGATLGLFVVIETEWRYRQADQ